MTKRMRIKPNPALSKPISTSVDENLQLLDTLMGNSPDLVTRRFLYGINDTTLIGVTYIKELANSHFVQDNILTNLMIEIRKVKSETGNIALLDPFTQLKDYILTAGDIAEIYDFKKLTASLLYGNTILFVEGYGTCFSISTKDWRQRSIEEPNTEIQIKGAKDGFNESTITNIALIRRKIKNVNLRFESKTVGETTGTDITIAYIADLADVELLDEVRNRIDGIDIEGVVSSGYIEHNVDNSGYSPFPSIYSTERPDLLCKKLLEGRIGLLVDGQPFAVIVPTLFTDFFKTIEDYSFNTDISTFLRLLRYISFILAVSIPAVYIALTSYHQEMIPQYLLISFLQQEQGTLLPVWLEVSALLFVYEVFAELSKRLPKVIGDTIILVGGIVISESAAKAGFISLSTLIVVSVTAITSYVFSNYVLSNTVIVLRLAFILAASLMGLYGIALVFILLVLHLCGLKSFDIPYFPPLGSCSIGNQRDSIIRTSKTGIFNKLVKG